MSKNQFLSKSDPVQLRINEIKLVFSIKRFVLLSMYYLWAESISDFKGFAGLYITDATEEYEFFGKLETGRVSNRIANTAAESLEQ